MRSKFKKIILSKEFLNYILLVSLEFIISIFNFYLSNYSNQFENIKQTFGSSESYLIKAGLFSIFFPLLIALFLGLLSKIIPIFKKSLLSNATTVVILIITVDLIILLLNILNPI